MSQEGNTRTFESSLDAAVDNKGRVRKLVHLRQRINSFPRDKGAEMVDMETKKAILTAQRNEITEHFVYDKLSQSIRDSHNKNILERLSRDELKHYHLWKEYTREEVQPDKFQKRKYYAISRIFGITFGMKLMERGDDKHGNQIRDGAGPWLV